MDSNRDKYKGHHHMFEVYHWGNKVSTHTWTIAAFQTELATDIKDTFTINNEEKALRFRLSVDPNGPNYLHFYLERMDRETMIERTVTFSRVVELGQRRQLWKGTLPPGPSKMNIFKEALSGQAFAPITLLVEVEVSKVILDVVNGEKVTPSPKYGSLVGNITKRYNETDDLPYGDVVLLCGEQSYSCHKFILAVRSDVFAAMFSQPMKESTDSIVEISDFEPHVLEKFIRNLMFMYTDDVGDVPIFEDASSLLALAEKYDVKMLKAVCERIICGLCNVSNVVEAAHLAYRLNAPILLSHAMGIITGNLKNLVRTEEFKKVKDQCPDILVEILKTISSTQ